MPVQSVPQQVMAGDGGHDSVTSGIAPNRPLVGQLNVLRMVGGDAVMSQIASSLQLASQQNARPTAEARGAFILAARKPLALAAANDALRMVGDDAVKSRVAANLQLVAQINVKLTVEAGGVFILAATKVLVAAVSTCVLPTAAASVAVLAAALRVHKVLRTTV